MFQVTYDLADGSTICFASNVSADDATLMVNHLLINGSNDHEPEEIISVSVTRK